MITAIILTVIAYVLGSLSSAIIVCQIMKLPDPRTQGSGNPGTTNVLRIGGKFPAALTLFGDMLKGFFPVLIGRMLGLDGIWLGLIAIGAVLGHIFPVFFKFEGGKGVATALGGLFAMSPLVGLLAIITWLLVAFITRYSSLASMIAVIAASIYALIFSDPRYVVPLIVIAAIVIWCHRENIQRLKSHTENKLSL